MNSGPLHLKSILNLLSPLGICSPMEEEESRKSLISPGYELLLLPTEIQLRYHLSYNPSFVILIIEILVYTFRENVSCMAR